MFVFEKYTFVITPAGHNMLAYFFRCVYQYSVFINN